MGIQQNPNIILSVVIPCRNEDKYIGACLEAVIDFDFPKKSMEVLVVDGISSDTTREIINKFQMRCPFIKLLNNPGCIVPSAMNIGIEAAVGKFIVRLDAHAVYPRTYIKDCLALLERTGAANAGGRFVTVPNGDGPWAVPVSEVTAHRFGVGAGAFRVGTKPGFVDTVPFGTFRKEVLKEVGLFDNRLTRNQDNELNARLRKHGYKIAFDPAIQIYYKNQAALSGLVHQGFFTGMWNVYTLTLHPYSFQWRRFIPVMFVSYLLSIPPMWLFTKWGPLYLVPAAAYALITLVASTTLLKGLSTRVRIAVTFVCYHVAYGSGTLFGLINLITGRWKDYLGQPLRK